jgi:hypothetical protein
MIDGSNDMKDLISKASIATGTGMATLPPVFSSPTFWIQVTGAIIGIIGLLYTRVRAKEARRANDLKEARDKWDKEVWEAKQKELLTKEGETHVDFNQGNKSKDIHRQGK